MNKNQPKQLQPLTIGLDVDKYQQMIDQQLDKQAREAINTRLSILFCNPSDQVRYDYLKRQHHNDPDISAGHNFIKGIIDGKLLDDDFKKYVEDYAERNFTRILNEAIEEALKHKANRIAFRFAQGKIKIEGYQIPENLSEKYDIKNISLQKK